MSDPQFQRGIAEFNEELFFECHDTLEELWMETSGGDRLFLQGLIQVSVGLYHFFCGNYKGAASQLSKGVHKLDRYRPSHGGIELEEFLERIGGWYMLAQRGAAGEHVSAGALPVPKLTYIHERPI